MDYVTRAEYLEFSGIDLDIELRKSNTDNPGKATEIFIKRVQDWVFNFMKFNFYFDYEDYDADIFKEGILHQIDYIRRNGDITIDGETTISKLAPNTLMVYKIAGYCNITPERVLGKSAWQ